MLLLKRGTVLTHAKLKSSFFLKFSLMSFRALCSDRPAGSPCSKGARAVLSAQIVLQTNCSYNFFKQNVLLDNVIPVSVFLFEEVIYAHSSSGFYCYETTKNSYNSCIYSLI